MHISYYIYKEIISFYDPCILKQPQKSRAFFFLNISSLDSVTVSFYNMKFVFILWPIYSGPLIIWVDLDSTIFSLAFTNVRK